MTVRLATPGDAGEVARMLWDFNTEFSEPTPEVPVLAERLAPMLASGEATVLLGRDPPVGFALLRFRRSYSSGAIDALLEELYVASAKRGQGLGRALLEAAFDAARERGATRIELNTSEDDRAARGLYERYGFTNREGGRDGPLMIYYERDL